MEYNNIVRIQNNESIMYGFHCTAFIEHMLAGKTLLEYANLFSPKDYEKDEKITHKYIKHKYGRRSESRF